MRGRNVIVLLVAVHWAVGSIAQAAPSFVSPSDQPGGQSAAASVAQWMDWGLSFDSVSVGDPLSDTTGAFQNQNQNYPVHMLGGAFGEGVRRAFEAPAGKPFLVPLLTYTCVNTAPGAGGTNDCSGAQETGIAELVATETDRFFVKVDGISVMANDNAAVRALSPEYLIETGLVTATAAAGNYYGADPGEYPGSFTTGFFAFANLPIGKHVLEYGAAIDEFEFANSVTAEIHVTPIPAALPLLATGLAALGWRARRRLRKD